MSHRALVLLLAPVVAGGVFLAMCEDDERASWDGSQNGAPVREQGLNTDSSEELMPPIALIPDGEWWGRARGWDILIRMKGQRGVAAIASPAGDITLSVVLTMPAKQVRRHSATTTVPDFARLLYVMSNTEHTSTWEGTLLLDEIPSDRIGTEDDVIDRIEIDRIDGTLRIQDVPFTIFRSDIHSPVDESEEDDAGVFPHLRRLVAEETLRGPDQDHGQPPPRGEDPTCVDLMWWNVGTSGSQRTRSRATVGLMADIVRGMEVLAMGNVEDAVLLEQLAAELGAHWRHTVSPRLGRTSETATRYGLIWNSRVVDLSGRLRVDSDPGDCFDRDPVYATFRTACEQLDFTLVCASIDGATKVDDRIMEIRELANVWTRVRASVGEDSDLILVGSFNRNIRDVESFAPLFEIPGMTRAIKGTPQTHISDRTCYERAYLSTAMTREWTGEAHVVDFDEMYFEGKDEEAQRVSDHRPVWLSLRIPASDDD